LQKKGGKETSRSCVMLVGTTGTGKTTLLNIFTGAEVSFQGPVSLNSYFSGFSNQFMPLINVCILTLTLVFLELKDSLICPEFTRLCLPKMKLKNETQI
jgi:hypothetical protein